MKKTPFLTVASVFILLLLTNVHLTSCTKTDTVHDTTIVRPAPSILSLLTGKQWELDSVFNNYTGPGTGTLVYARGASNNSENLDNYYATFTIDGEVWQAENGTYYLSQWSFIDSDSAVYKVVSPVYGTDYARILNLSGTTLNLYDSTAHARDVDIIAP